MQHSDNKFFEGIELLEGIEFLDPEELNSGYGNIDPSNFKQTKTQRREAILAWNPELEKRLDQVDFVSPNILRGYEYFQEISQVSPAERGMEYKLSRQQEWNRLLERSDSIFRELKTNYAISSDSVKALVKAYLTVFSVDRNILLTLSQLPSSLKYVPAEHAMKVCILSLCIGTSMGYSQDQLIELGISAFCSDLGMVFMEDIYDSTKPLTKSQYLKLRSHPMLSANVVDSTRGMPPMTGLVVYQVHERENGSGYPKQRKGRFIHPYAKVIAVADVFQALCSPRAHRPSLKPFDAMTRVMSMVKIGYLSVDIVRPFMQYTSLYPIGSLVRLSDKSIARVVEANQAKIKTPTISILFDTHGIPLLPEDIYQIDLSKDTSFQIVEALKESDVSVDKLDGL